KIIPTLMSAPAVTYKGELNNRLSWRYIKTIKTIKRGATVLKSTSNKINSLKNLLNIAAAHSPSVAINLPYPSIFSFTRAISSAYHIYAWQLVTTGFWISLSKSATSPIVGQRGQGTKTPSASGAFSYNFFAIL